MSVQETNGYLDVENATLRSSKVEVTSNLGIANTNPEHAFSVGSNLYVSTESSNVISIKGNVVTEGIKMGFLEITPSYDFAAVSNVGNVTANTIIFNNDNQGFVATGNATIGSTLTISGFRITAAAAAEDDLDAITTSTEDKPNAGTTQNPIHLEGATTATSYTTGILQVGNSTNQGGMGVAGNVYVNQGVYTQDLSVENVVSNLAVNTDDLFVDIENSRVGIGKTEPTVALDVVGAVTASGGLTVGSNFAVNTDDLFVDTVNSRVGIGKTEPTVALDVAGAVTASGNMTVTGTSKVGIGTDTLDAVLNVGTGTPTSGDQILKLNTDSPWAFEHETNGLALRSSAANKKLYVQASDFSNVATFDVNGNNVGIGLTDPASKLHVMGDIIGRNVSNTHTITGSDGGADTFTLLPDQNRVVVTHVGSSTLNGAYTVNMTGGIPTIIGSILYLEIVSSKTNTDGASRTHSTTLQIAAATVLTTGSISVAAVNNPGDVYERTLRRTIILTSDGWKDYSVYPKLSVPTTDDAIIFSTTENTTQNDAGSDKPLVERLRITGNGNVGIGTNDPDKKLTVAGNMELGTRHADYQHFRLGGGNSSGFLYGAFAKYSDGIHMGYNFYNDNSSNQIPNAAGATSRISMNFGQIQLHTGGVNTEPNNKALCITNNGNVGIGRSDPGSKLHLLGVGTGSGPKLRFETLNNGNGNYTVSGTEIGGIQFGADDFGWSTQHMSSEIVGIHDTPNYSGARGILAFKTSSTQGANPSEKMRIKHNGNVGLGLTDPNTRIHMYKSDFSLPTNGTEFGSTSEHGIAFKSRIHSGGQAPAPTWYNSLAIDNFKIFFNPRSYSYVGNSQAGSHGTFNIGGGFVNNSQANTPILTVTTNDRVGINREQPSYTLDINGSIRYTGTPGSNSDRRIKKNILDVNDASALETIRLIKPKRYDYIDTKSKDTEDTVWGFIAQEVREVLPYATDVISDFIPNIMTWSNVVDSNVIMIDTTELLSNTGRVFLKDVFDQSHYATIAEVIDANSLRVEEDLSTFTGSRDTSGDGITETQTITITVEEYNALEDVAGYEPVIESYTQTTTTESITVEEYNALEDTTGYEAVISNYTKTHITTPGSEIFVYGQEVDDFHVLKKDAIWTVATAALQEVDRQQQSDKIRITELETQITSVLSRLDALEA
jgi:hypothetical protein